MHILLENDRKLANGNLRFPGRAVSGKDIFDP